MNNDKITETDLLEQVDITIDKEAFQGPFTCHGKNTEITRKQVVLSGITMTYETWQCQKCKKEYLDSRQAQHLEKIWLIEKLLRDKNIHFDRSINFDGKAYFFRFPKEFTNHWRPDMNAHVELLNSNEFLVRIEEKQELEV